METEFNSYNPPNPSPRSNPQRPNIPHLSGLRSSTNGLRFSGEVRFIFVKNIVSFNLRIRFAERSNRPILSPKRPPRIVFLRSREVCSLTGSSSFLCRFLLHTVRWHQRQQGIQITGERSPRRRSLNGKFIHRRQHRVKKGCFRRRVVLYRR